MGLKFADGTLQTTLRYRRFSKRRWRPFRVHFTGGTLVQIRTKRGHFRPWLARRRDTKWHEWCARCFSAVSSRASTSICWSCISSSASSDAIHGSWRLWIRAWSWSNMNFVDPKIKSTTTLTIFEPLGFVRTQTVRNVKAATRCAIRHVYGIRHSPSDIDRVVGFIWRKLGREV